MNWLIPSIVATLAGTALLAAIYLYLYQAYHYRYMFFWCLGWVAFCVHFIFEIISAVSSHPLLTAGNYSVILFSGLLLMQGTYMYIGQRMKPFWWILGLVGVGWITGASLSRIPLLLITVPCFTCLTAIYIWTGLQFIQQAKSVKFTASFTGWGFILWGIQNVTFPFTRNIPWFAPWAFLITSTFEFAIAQGILLLFFEQIQQQLSSSKKEYQAIFNATNEAIFIHDIQSGKILDVNEPMLTMFGYSYQEAILLNLDDLSEGITPYSLKEAHQRIEETISQGPQLFEWRSRKKTGEIFWSEVSLRKVVLNNKERVLAVVRDINDRKNTENALREIDARYRNLVETAQEGVWALDADFCTMYTNRKMEEILGYAEGTMLGLPFSSFLPESEQADHLVKIEERRHGKSGLYERKLLRKDGKVITALVSSSPLFKQDIFEGAVALLTDISEWKQTQEALRQTADINAALADLYQPLVLADKSSDDFALIVLGHVCRLTRSEYGFISDIDPVNGDNVIHTMTAQTFEHCRIDPGADVKTFRFQREADGHYPALWGHALNTRKAFYTNHPENHSAARGVPDGHILMKNFLAVPVMLGEEPVGMIAIANTDQEYSEQELNITQRIAEYYALAIQQKRAEKALQNSERRYRNLFSSSPTAIVLSTIAEGKIFEVNDNFVRLSGYTREEVVGRTSFELNFWVKEDDRKRVVELVQRDGEVQNYEVELRIKSGEIYPVLLSLTTANVGGVNCLISNWVDISERKRSEQLINTRLMLSDIARKGTLDNVMQTALDMVEAITRSQIGFFHFLEADQENLTLQIWSTNTMMNMCKAQAKGAHYPISQAGVWVDCVRLRQPIVHNDYARLAHRKGMPEGHAPVIRELTVPILSGDVVVAVIGVGNKPEDYTPKDVDMVKTMAEMVIDIVTRKRAEEALRVSEARFRTLFHSHGAPFLLLEPLSGAIVDANASAEKFYGYSQDELRQMNISDINTLPPEISTASRQEVLRNTRDYFVFPHRLKGGEIRVVEVYSSAMDIDGQKLLFSIIHDITQRQQAEDEIKRLNAELELRVRERTAQLESSNRELEAFTYSASHDLRAPLRAVDGFSQILLEDHGAALNIEGQELLHKIRANVHKMSQLITDLLRLSRVTKGEFVRMNVNMWAQVCSVIDEIAPEETRQHLTFTVHPLPPACADLSLMRQVWSNLISNAVKYTTPKPERVIEVGGMVEGNRLVYYVRDNGTGFNPDYKHKLFGVFQRLHNDDQFEGTGVGLAIVQRIVQRHGGQVWAEGELDKGATFYFSLPIQTSSSTESG